MSSDPGRQLAAAAMSSVIIGLMWASGGVARQLSGLVVLVVLLTPPGPGQPSAARAAVEAAADLRKRVWGTK